MQKFGGRLHCPLIGTKTSQSLTSTDTRLLKKGRKQG